MQEKHVRSIDLWQKHKSDTYQIPVCTEDNLDDLEFTKTDIKL